LPTPAALGFARSCGVTMNQVEQEESEKGAWLVVRQPQPGRLTAELLIPILERALAGLPIPKRMRWADHEDEFVRPVPGWYFSSAMR
jgi:glycyl-tRNA synthetase beta chain